MVVFGRAAFRSARKEAAIDHTADTADYQQMAPHLILRDWWSRTGASIATRPASEKELAALEARYEISLPEDFRQYLAQSVPVADNWDAENGNWWPFEQIKTIADEYEHVVAEPIASHVTKHLFFLDHMQWSWAWAISCMSDNTFGKVALIGGHSETYVAGSFAEFVERYTSDWADVSRLSAAAPVKGSI